MIQQVPQVIQQLFRQSRQRLQRIIMLMEIQTAAMIHELFEIEESLLNGFAMFKQRVQQ